MQAPYTAQVAPPEASPAAEGNLPNGLGGLLYFWCIFIFKWPNWAIRYLQHFFCPEKDSESHPFFPHEEPRRDHVSASPPTAAAFSGWTALVQRGPKGEGSFTIYSEKAVGVAWSSVQPERGRPTHREIAMEQIEINLQNLILDLASWLF